jgi:hypothetical protein
MLQPPPPPPQDDARSASQAYANLHARLIQQLESGVQPHDVHRYLIEDGYSSEQADQIVQSAAQARAEMYVRQGVNIDDPESLRALGRRNMALGASLVALAIVGTLGSCMVAIHVGGVYWVLGGLVFGGITLFLRGFSQVGRARDGTPSAVGSHRNQTQSEPTTEGHEAPHAGNRRSRRGRRPPQSW